MPATTMTQRFLVTRIEAQKIAPEPTSDAPPSTRILITAAPVGDTTNPPPTPQWAFDDPAAATFFVVNEEIELTFSRPAA